MEDELARTLNPPVAASPLLPRGAPLADRRSRILGGRSDAQLAIGIVGGGWAGLAAAVEATARGHAVTLYEMAHSLGGRARRLPQPLDGLALDNGQHILIGAYGQTLRLMRRVGVDVDRALLRLPLTLVDAQDRGLRLPPGRPVPAFVRGVLGARGWTRRDKLALLRAAGGWLLRGFRCDARATVADLAAALPATLRRTLIDPLCVAALNTPARDASAQVFLRVLHDALFAGRGSSDLLLPRVDLGALFPDAAGAWLQAHGAALRLGRRIERLERDAGGGWQVDGERHDRVVLACTASEAARLADAHAPAWAATARALRYEPIATVLLRAPGATLPAPIVALEERPEAPVQYVFDLGRLRGADGLLACVVSGAGPWIARGSERLAAAAQAQVAAQLAAHLRGMPTVARTISEKRATFVCLPALQRPAAAIATGLRAAGDYVDGPYPATLEGAVRAGVAAAGA